MWFVVCGLWCGVVFCVWCVVCGPRWGVLEHFLSKMLPRGTKMVQNGAKMAQNGALEGPKWTKMEPGRCLGGTLEAQMGQRTEKRGQGTSGSRFWMDFGSILAPSGPLFEGLVAIFPAFMCCWIFVEILLDFGCRPGGAGGWNPSL